MQSASWSERGRVLLRDAQVAWRILKHRRTPWPARLVAAATVGYIVSPVQAIPNYIPVIGPVDDIGVVMAGSWLLRRMVPSSILAECGGAARPVPLGNQTQEIVPWPSHSKA